jgi:hypothetical protein
MWMLSVLLPLDAAPCCFVASKQAGSMVASTFPSAPFSLLLCAAGVFTGVGLPFAYGCMMLVLW